MKGTQRYMLVAIFIACVVVISNINMAAAKVLSYRVIIRGNEPKGCYRNICAHHKVNPYRRGCEMSQRCHRPGKPVPTKIL
ncbi:hypothetical protein CARUB_v10003284mg [Capsella rubella]|uniref:Uncharacterized protein n=1 Tax=Capsella rubella TaxID=81985 RepID=R0FC62_9BRAS|nr:hypothetical protein CARUB_v10003284mg [Capsella rubella]